MEETIRLTALSFSIIIFLVSMSSITAGIVLAAKYMPKRKRRTVSADNELKRLAEWILLHHPEVVEAQEGGLVVDRAIQLLSETKTPEVWKMQ